MKAVALIIIVLVSLDLPAQKYFTKAGSIEFHSETPLERIHAVNNKAVSVIDLEKGQVQFSVLMKGFHFENALMQVHFNENYVYSDQYPKATFRSTESQLTNLDLSQDGEQVLQVKGDLTIKGVTKEVEAAVTIRVAGEGFSGTTTFDVSPADFEIEIPKLVRNKIAKTISIQISAVYEAYQKVLKE